MRGNPGHSTTYRGVLICNPTWLCEMMSPTSLAPHPHRFNFVAMTWTTA